jgi:hypothetical protein
MPADILGFRVIEALALTYPAMVQGDAVLNSLTGEIEGGPEEADAARAEAAEKAEEAKKTDSTANWKAAKAEAEDGNAVDNSDLDDATVDQLKEIADNEGVDLTGISHKADIVKAIKKDRKNKA